MPQKFEEPEFPFVHKLDDGLKRGQFFRVVANAKEEAPDRFVLQFATNEEEGADIVNINVKFQENQLLFNHCKDGQWMEQQVYKNGVAPGGKFHLLVLVRRDRFEIKYTGEVYTYPLHIEAEKLKVVRVKNFDAIKCKRILVSADENENETANDSGEE